MNFLKKKKKPVVDSQSASTSSTSHVVKSTSSGNVTTILTTIETTTTTNYTQRSYSISATEGSTLAINNNAHLLASSSMPSLLNKSYLSPKTDVDKSKKRFSHAGIPLGITQTDAKPITSPSVPSGSKINLNYQSPYSRTSPVYRSVQNYPGTSSFPKPVIIPASSWNKPPISPNQLKPNPNALTARKSSFPSPSSSTSSLNRIPASPTITGSKKGKQEKKKIEVKKTGKFYDKATSNVPVYKTSSKKRGEVLIINNIMFKKVDQRDGAHVDEENLEELFKQMGFKVKKEQNLKMQDMEKRIKSFSKNGSLKSADISIVVVMSHGTNNSIEGGYTEVYGSDDIGVSTEKLLEYFTAENCPQMADKPKIFIFQCCRGDNLAFVKNDAVHIKHKATVKDTLIAYSTLPGFTSLRDPEQGTWYIQNICEVFSEHAHEYHVEELLKIVNAKLAKFDKTYVQTSTYESRGFHTCYLHPI